MQSKLHWNFLGTTGSLTETRFEAMFPEWHVNVVRQKNSTKQRFSWEHFDRMGVIFSAATLQQPALQPGDLAADVASFPGDPVNLATNNKGDEKHYIDQR